MTQYGTWVSYSGTARIWLAIVLLAAAGGLAYGGTRWPRPIRAARPGRAAVIFMLLTWVLALGTFAVCVSVYIQQERQGQVAQAAPANPITPVTLIAAGATFVIILISSPDGFRARLTAAVVGAMAGPMIFELPFDLIVMARTYPPILPDPALYRALFFLPLFLVEIITLSFLTLPAMAKLSRGAFFSVALMFTVFAVWGLLGFGYPSTPATIALNVASKILAFVAVLSLFLPQRARAGTPGRRPAPRPTAGAYRPARLARATGSPGRSAPGGSQKRAVGPTSVAYTTGKARVTTPETIATPPALARRPGR